MWLLKSMSTIRMALNSTGLSLSILLIFYHIYRIFIYGKVCGMLEEVVVPSRCNANGEAYGFVRFSNVRDVGKLLRTVNPSVLETLK